MAVLVHGDALLFIFLMIRKGWFIYTSNIAGFSPSVCSGVVAKIVKVESSSFYQSIQGGDSHIPAMIETTAAVHPGGSGGAIINSKGHMIGLVTRYSLLKCCLQKC